MTPSRIRRQQEYFRTKWTNAERRDRQRLSQERCAELLEQFMAQEDERLQLWAGGAMSAADIERIVG